MRNHIENVGKALAPTKIDYVENGHGGADKKLVLNGEVDEIQRKLFGRILRDKAAESILKLP